MPDYTNAAQQRILRALQALAGHEVHGLAPSALARELGCNASSVTRDLANLRAAGLAEEVPEVGRWRLAPRIVQIALKHMASLDRAERRLDEIRGRYSRT